MTKKNIQKWSKMRLVKNWTKIVQKKPFRFEMLENTDQVVETPDRSMKIFENLKIQKFSEKKLAMLSLGFTDELWETQMF